MKNTKKNSLLNLFEDLVSIYSPSGQEEALQKYIVAKYQKAKNLKVEVDKTGNVFIRVLGKGEPLFLSAHMDTVEPSQNIKVEVSDGWVKSKGETILGADNKLSLACILHLLDQIEEGKVKNRPLEVLCTVSEETSNLGAIHFDKSKLKAKKGFIFDSSQAVGSIIRSSPYYARFDITLLGKSAHAGYPELAQPVIPLMLKLVKEIESLRKSQILITIGKIHGGMVRNTILGEVVLQGEVRSIDADLFEATLKKLNTILKQKDKVTIKSSVVVENPGYVHDKKSLDLLQKRISNILHSSVKIVDTFGVSDANLLNSKKIKVYNIGDGSVDSHTTKERFKYDDMLKLYRLIESLSKY